MNVPDTYFAPAERVDDTKLQEQIDIFSNDPETSAFSDALPVIFLILNANRQIIYTNKRVLEALGEGEFSHVLGKRVGELFHCVHSSREKGGCGTSRYCQNCGAVNAILEAQAGTQSIKECRLTMQGGAAADYRVWATPHQEADEFFTFFTLQDIQHEKRRKALERTFFHDILNTAGGISGLTNILGEADDEGEKEELLNLLQKSSYKLIEEIHSGRALSLAENGELKLEPVLLDLKELIQDCIYSYTKHPAGIDKKIELSEDSPEITLESDRAILGRVISNLLKNALEASKPGGLVTIGCSQSREKITISVHNSTHMTEQVKAQVFDRSFSTKGEGRGIGTYSIRLFTEKYLNGKVSFTSDPVNGTHFYVNLKNCSK